MTASGLWFFLLSTLYLVFAVVQMIQRDWTAFTACIGAAAGFSALSRQERVS